MTELNGSLNFSFEKDAINHLKKIDDIDVFIMSYLTSMGTDANFSSNCTIIANFIDDHGIMNKRNTDSFPSDMLGKDLIRVNSYKDLISSIKISLYLTQTTNDIKPFEYWDDKIKLNDAISNVMSKI